MSSNLIEGIFIIMNWEKYKEDWDDIRNTIFEKLDKSEEKNFKEFIINIANKNFNKATINKFRIRIAQSILYHLNDMSDEQLKEKAFEDYEEDE